MIIYAYVLLVLLALSILVIPILIGKERTIADACGNIAFHIAFMVFIVLFLVSGGV